MHPDIDLKAVIRTLPDWPTAGITFRDITPIFKHPEAFHYVVDALVAYLRHHQATHIAAIDARGFLAASVVAYQLNLPLILVRKQGKLPGACISEAYTLEYGTTCVEMHTDACGAGDKIILLDDLIATGGTLMAAISLIQKLGAEVIQVAALIDLPALGGSEKVTLLGIPCHSLVTY